MTLVVSRQIEDEIFVLSDTKFTFPDSEAYSETNKFIGGLKSIILAPGLFVAYAGEVKFATSAIEKIYERNINIFDKNIVINHFFESHLNSNNETDYLLGFILENKNDGKRKYEKEIFKIADKQINASNVNSYIGGNEAFSKFQEAFHGNITNNRQPNMEVMSLGKKEIPKFHDILRKAVKAMDYVILDDSDQTSSVGGFRTLLISYEDQFKYVEYVLLQGKVIPVNNYPNSPLHFGNVEEGSQDNRHLGFSVPPGIGIYTFYSYSGKFGILYNPESSFKPKIKKYANIEQFKEDINIEVDSYYKRAFAAMSRFP